MSNEYNGLFQNCECDYNFRAKDRNIRRHISYMLARTQSMFRYDGLPDTIPERMLELYLQTNGNVCIASVNDNLYAFVGGLGGEPDVYYMPTIYTVANPALNFSKNLRIGEECVVIPSDSAYTGLLPLFHHYASGMVENELSMHITTIMSRLVSLITANDERTRQSAETMLQNIEDGKLGVVFDNALIEGIRTQPYATSGANGRMTDLIEYEQYLKASWYNEIGLNANYNMKRESLNSSESQLNNDALLPLIDDMLKCRERGVEQVNKMFGTNIRVALASAWEDNQQEIDMKQSDESEGEEDENEDNTSDIE